MLPVNCFFFFCPGDHIFKDRDHILQPYAKWGLKVNWVKEQLIWVMGWKEANGKTHPRLELCCLLSKPMDKGTWEPSMAGTELACAPVCSCLSVCLWCFVLLPYQYMCELVHM